VILYLLKLLLQNAFRVKGFFNFVVVAVVAVRQDKIPQADVKSACGRSSLR